MMFSCLTHVCIRWNGFRTVRPDFGKRLSRSASHAGLRALKGDWEHISEVLEAFRTCQNRTQRRTDHDDDISGLTKTRLLHLSFSYVSNTWISLTVIESTQVMGLPDPGIIPALMSQTASFIFCNRSLSVSLF